MKPSPMPEGSIQIRCSDSSANDSIHDFQATVLHLLGIDHESLTYKLQGRYFRLTDVHGKVVKDILT